MMTGLFDRRRLLQGLAAAAVLALAGCGRKGQPLPPPNADPLSPRRYPVDPDVAPQYRNVPPEFSPPPPPPPHPLQGPLYPVQPGQNDPFNPLYQQ